MKTMIIQNMVNEIYQVLNQEADLPVELWEVEELVKILSNIPEQVYENKIGLS